MRTERALAWVEKDLSIQPQLDRGTRRKLCARVLPTAVRWNDLCAMKLPYVCGTRGLSQ